MPRQYTKDKTARLSFRVNDTLYDWVSKRANSLGVSPCDFARSLLFQQMAVEQALRDIDTPKDVPAAVEKAVKKPVAEIARAARCELKRQSRR